MTQWEYASLMNEGPAARDDLNAMGAEGWELVSVVAGQHSTKILYVFKRPIDKSRKVAS
jgi:hypothetical protein